MNDPEWKWHAWRPWEKAVWTLTIVLAVSVLLFVAANASPSAHSRCLVTSTRSVSCS